MNQIKEMPLKRTTREADRETKIVKKHGKMQLADIEQYKTFKIGDVEFIVLKQFGSKTFCLTRDFIAEGTMFDWYTNNLANASMLKVLDKFENKITNIIGANNLCEFEIDLTTYDGLNDYETITRKTGLLTYVQYCEHCEGIKPYEVDDWWWLANAYSTPQRSDQYCICCVTGDGGWNIGDCSNYFGIRAVCLLRSDIFVSE